MMSVYYLRMIVLVLFAAGAQASVAEILLEVPDPARDREIPIKVYLPKIDEPVPVVLFSHGLGGSREGAAYLGRYWAEQGYVGVFLQHPGSDREILRQGGFSESNPAIKQAMRIGPYLDRVADVQRVIDMLEVAVEDPDHPLYRRINPARIAMSGHSYGSHTTQALMGQRNPLRSGESSLTDHRITCFILMSPTPHRRLSDRMSFGSVNRPVLCMTGTEDTSPLGSQVSAEDRRRVYQGLPAGGKFQLVFEQGDHMVFSGYQHRGRPPHDPRYHRAIQVITTAFLAAYLRDDREALAWLAGDGVREVLVPEDVWEWK